MSMRLAIMDSLQSQHIYKFLLSNCQEISNFLDFNESDIKNKLNLSSNEYKQYQENTLRLEISNLTSFSNNLGISLDHLVRGSYDLGQLRTDFKGLPERYNQREEKLSTNRGLSTIFNYLIEHYGNNFTNTLFKKLHLDIKSLQESDEQFVSSKLSHDLLILLKEEGFGDNTYKEIAYQNFVSNNQNKILQNTQHLSTKDFYEYALLDFLPKNFDKLCNYKIQSLSENSCILTIKHSEAAYDVFRDKIPAGRELCLFKQGSFQALRMLTGRPLAEIKEKKCCYKGDQVCEFEIVYDDNIRQSSDQISLH